jgi:hypothetical protein
MYYFDLDCNDNPSLKANFQSSHEAPRSSLRVHAWALSSNNNAKQLILIRCKHSQQAARSFVRRGLEIRRNPGFIVRETWETITINYLIVLPGVPNLFDL